MNLIRTALRYVLIVFASGFVLGTLRTLWLAPQIGERHAELLELPVMIAISWLAARHVMRRPAAPRQRRHRMVVGGVALAMLLAVEFLVVVPLSGQDPVNGVIERDPVTGAAYALSLLVFAALPALISVPRADAR